MVPAVRSSKESGSRRSLKKALDEGITRFEATEEAEEKWLQETRDKWYIALYSKANGWYNGANTPGKKIEPYNHTGGMVLYPKHLDASLKNDDQGLECCEIEGMIALFVSWVRASALAQQA
ncbi:hypothetical protein LTR37_018709 [Vermiconidia calcicola]|uniref:Uncharacterized protein n=1 Tax=Vermiconidia calcicola TaxID=1690605 RepID=A0ACC3MHY7_9PEZI|nr:hypothetical protein LTR37_018709 [Vermiconidia calcicola]